MQDRRVWNAKLYQNPDGTTSRVFSTGAVHYKETPNGQWLDKRQAFKAGSGAKGPLHHVSDESDVTMETYQRGSGGSRRWVVEFVEKLTGNGIRFVLQFQPSVTAGSPVLSFNDGGGGVWTYTHTRAGGKMLGPPTSTKLGPRTYTFSYEMIGAAPPLTLEADGSINCPGIFVMPRAHIEGADREIYDASAWTLGAGTLSFSYDDTDLPPEAFPYRVDPSTTFSVTASADDTSVYKTGTVYPPDSAVGRLNSAVYIMAGRLNLGLYETYCALARWDIGSFGLGTTVTGATFRGHCTMKNNVDSRVLTADWRVRDGTDADYSETALTGAVTSQSIEALTLDADNDIPLNAAASNITPNSVAGVRFHISGGQPTLNTGDNRVRFAAWNDATLPEPRLIVDYAVDADIEIQRPTATNGVTNLTPSTDPTAYQTIDDDPDASGTDFLTGTDPSGASGATDGPRLPNANATVTGFSGGFTNPANAYDGNTGTAATTTLGSNGQNHGGYFSFSSTAFAGIPSNATIDAVTVTARQGVNSNNRSDQFFQLGTANGTLIGNEVQFDATNVVTDDAITGFTTMPTRAQLLSGTFGVRVRAVRTNNVTYSLYELSVTVTYSAAGSTTSTEVRAVMSDPTKSLATGTATGEVRIQVRKLGSGSDPLARAEIREGGALKGTIIADTAVSVVGGSGTVLSGTFNQSIISNKNNVEVWVVGTGAAGGLLEVGAVEWAARTTTGSVHAGQSKSTDRESTKVISKRKRPQSARSTGRESTKVISKRKRSRTAVASDRPTVSVLGKRVRRTNALASGRTLAKAFFARKRNLQAWVLPRPSASGVATRERSTSVRSEERTRVSVLPIVLRRGVSIANVRTSAQVLSKRNLARTLKADVRGTSKTVSKVAYAKTARAEARAQAQVVSQRERSVSSKSVDRPASGAKLLVAYKEHSKASDRALASAVLSREIHPVANAHPRKAASVTANIESSLLAKASERDRGKANPTAGRLIQVEAAAVSRDVSNVLSSREMAPEAKGASYDAAKSRMFFYWTSVARAVDRVETQSVASRTRSTSSKSHSRTSATSKPVIRSASFIRSEERAGALTEPQRERSGIVESQERGAAQAVPTLQSSPVVNSHARSMSKASFRSAGGIRATSESRGDSHALVSRERSAEVGTKERSSALATLSITKDVLSKAEGRSSAEVISTRKLPMRARAEETADYAAAEGDVAASVLGVGVAIARTTPLAQPTVTRPSVAAAPADSDTTATAVNERAFRGSVTSRSYVAAIPTIAKALEATASGSSLAMSASSRQIQSGGLSAGTHVARGVPLLSIQASGNAQDDSSTRSTSNVARETIGRAYEYSSTWAAGDKSLQVIGQALSQATTRGLLLEHSVDEEVLGYAEALAISRTVAEGINTKYPEGRVISRSKMVAVPTVVVNAKGIAPLTSSAYSNRASVLRTIEGMAIGSSKGRGVLTLIPSSYNTTVGRVLIGSGSS